MKLELRKVKPEGTDFHFTETAEEMEISVPGVKFPEPIEVDLSATQSGDEVFCQGDIFCNLEVECSRCLEVYDVSINTQFQFVVQMIDMNGDGEDAGDEDDDYELIPKSQSSLDISQRVRDAILLNISLKPLCSEDCQGLCLMCGVNLNESDCECLPDKSDERWDELKNLFDS